MNRLFKFKRTKEIPIKALFIRCLVKCMKIDIIEFRRGKITMDKEKNVMMTEGTVFKDNAMILIIIHIHTYILPLYIYCIHVYIQSTVCVCVYIFSYCAHIYFQHIHNYYINHYNIQNTKVQFQMHGIWLMKGPRPVFWTTDKETEVPRAEIMVSS